jgi:hypothetical protein
MLLQRLRLPLLLQLLVTALTKKRCTLQCWSARVDGVTAKGSAKGGVGVWVQHGVLALCMQCEVVKDTVRSIHTSQTNKQQQQTATASVRTAGGAADELSQFRSGIEVWTLY